MDSFLSNNLGYIVFILVISMLIIYILLQTINKSRAKLSSKKTPKSHQKCTDCSCKCSTVKDPKAGKVYSRSARCPKNYTKCKKCVCKCAVSKDSKGKKNVVGTLDCSNDK